VGAAIIAALTSLDEVLLEVLPVRRGVPELATGNLFGTLAAFTTGVLGLAALVRPLTLDAGANLAFLASAALYALVGTVFFIRGRAGRVLGFVVLAAYLVWLVVAAA
jgi:cation:H+ antiporter